MIVAANAPNPKEANYCKKGHDDDFIVRTLLKRQLVNGKTIYVKDLDKDNFFREKDIDLLLYNYLDNTATAEVKADAFPKLKDGRKYIFLELVSNSKKFEESGGQDGLGCILTSKAKFFIFYFTKYDYYFAISSQKLRNFILQNKEKYQEKIANTWSPDNKEIWYHSSGYIVPVLDILQQAGGVIRKSRYTYEDIKQELNL